MRIDEVKITDPTLRAKIDELARLKERVEELKRELKPLEKELKEVAEEVLPIVEMLDDKVARTEKAVITIVRASHEKETVKYKEAYEAALGKVNAQTRKVLMDIANSLTSVHQVSAQFKAITLEGVVYEGARASLFRLVSEIKRKVSGWIREMRGIGREVNVLERIARSVR